MRQVYCPTARLLVLAFTYKPSGQATKNGLLSAVVRLVVACFFKCVRLPNYSSVSLDETNAPICKHVITHNAICYTGC